MGIVRQSMWALPALAVWRVYVKQRQRSLVGCRVSYARADGTTAFGYVSHDTGGGEVIVQNPWRRYSTTMPKQDVQTVHSGDWNVTDLPLSDEMFRFFQIKPQWCGAKR